MNADTVHAHAGGRHKLAARMWNFRVLYLMIFVGVAYFVIFKYATLYGLLIAFKDYKFKDGIWIARPASTTRR